MRTNSSEKLNYHSGGRIELARDWCMNSSLCGRFPDGSLLAVFAAILVAIAIPLIAAENVTFPADCGSINVKNCGVKGNGTADDTDSLLAAIPRIADPWGSR
jgi:hypothetical protein